MFCAGCARVLVSRQEQQLADHVAAMQARSDSAYSDSWTESIRPSPAAKQAANDGGGERREASPTAKSAASGGEYRYVQAARSTS